MTPSEVFIIREPTRHRSAASGRLPCEANIRGQNVRGNGFPRRDWIEEKTDRRAGAIRRNLPSDEATFSVAGSRLEAQVPAQ